MLVRCGAYVMGDACAGGECAALISFAAALPPAALSVAHLVVRGGAEPQPFSTSYRLRLLISPASARASMQRGDSRLPTWRMHCRACFESGS